MRTLVISDMHLGLPSGEDLLREYSPRALLEALGSCERLVLLGDVFELRDASADVALAAARPLFQQLGAALADKQLVLCPGNHDYALISPWLKRMRTSARKLGLEQIIAPHEAAPLLATVAGWVAPADFTIAYPGLWLREDVYATHGHYLDCHAPLTSGERLMIAATGRVSKRRRSSLSTVEEYEAVTGPLYRLLDRHALLSRVAASRAVARLGRAVTGLSGHDLVLSERRAMGELAARLGVGESYVVFGHTHREGPLPDEDAAEWVGRLGARLVNCGSWVGQRADAGTTHGAASWRGSCVIVEDSGSPRVESLEPGSSAST
jgi:predicted phosphodiesterase